MSSPLGASVHRVSRSDSRNRFAWSPSPPRGHDHSRTHTPPRTRQRKVSPPKESFVEERPTSLFSCQQSLHQQRDKEWHKQQQQQETQGVHRNQQLAPQQQTPRKMKRAPSAGDEGGRRRKYGRPDETGKGGGDGSGRFELHFDTIPLWLRRGPWSPVARVIIPAAICAIALFALTEHGRSVFDSDGGFMVFPAEGAPLQAMLPALLAERPRLVSGVAAVYMGWVILFMCHVVGPEPLASYTLVSWCLLCARHGARALGAASSPINEALRFPSMAGAIVTVTLWWFVLAPIIYQCLPTAAERRRFVKFNLSPFLVNIHIVNLPLCLLDFALGPRRLVAMDLWAGLVVGITYLVFYLLCLDANGIHLYIILSPRTNLCVFAYGLVFVIYYLIWRHFPTAMTISVK